MARLVQEAACRKYGWKRPNEEAPAGAWPSRSFKVREIFAMVLPRLIRTRF